MMNTSQLTTQRSIQPLTPPRVGQSASPTKRRMDLISMRLSSLNQGISEERNSRIDTLERQIQELNQTVADIQKNTDQKCQELTDRLSSQEQTLQASKQMRDQLAQETTESFQDITTRVDDMITQAQEVCLTFNHLSLPSLTHTLGR